MYDCNVLTNCLTNEKQFKFKTFLYNLYIFFNKIKIYMNTSKVIINKKLFKIYKTVLFLINKN